MAGPRRYAAFLTGAHPLPPETRAYVAALAPAASLPPAGLFALKSNAGRGAQVRSPELRATGLFVALGGSRSR